MVPEVKYSIIGSFQRVGTLSIVSEAFSISSVRFTNPSRSSRTIKSVGSADDGFYVDCINPVFQVLLRKRVYRRYGDCAELMECDDGVPVFVMPLEQKEYFISFFYAVFRKDVSGFCT